MSELEGSCDLTVVVLTLNEERHIARCIGSVRGLARRIVVVDSGSTDRTRQIAEELGADVFANPFVSHARQLNWALANASISTAWVMKLDADEYPTPELVRALGLRIARAPGDVHGFTVNLRRIFMNRWLRHGSLYPLRLLRIWRLGLGRCEERLMDEHLVVRGRIEHVDADFADHNLASFTTWTDKHNRYASLEAAEMLLRKSGSQPHGEQTRPAGQAGLKRWVKENVYARTPLGLRAMVYFLYRYLVRLGFLDGWPGFVFHFFQGWWYRALVDVKVHEVEAAMRQRGLTLEEAIEETLGLKLTASGSQ